jgi:hypothetical protein
MNVRHLLVAAAMWFTIPAFGVAGDAARPAKAAPRVCPQGTPPTDWHVTENVNYEYPGLKPSETTMKLHPHKNPNAPGEWQIEFAGNKPTSPKPPGADVMHFIKVCWKELDKAQTPHSPPSTKPIAVNPYLVQAYAVLSGQNDYYIATGYLDGEPTMMVLTLEPSKVQTKMGFTLVLVKLDERTPPPGVRQGGVIHGNEN